MQRAEQRKSVLVVDDNRDNRVILSKILESAGYGVHQASDCAQAVRLVRRGVADVVLMDLCMPRMDGWQATRVIRSDPAVAHVPIVAVTALASHRDGSLLEGGEWNAVLFKPIPLQDVLAAVARCVGGAGEGAAPRQAGPRRLTAATPLLHPPGTWG